MGNELIGVRWGHGWKFLGDFLSRHSGMESGHDRFQLHTGAAHADGSARGGEQGVSEQPSWTPHLFDRQVHSLDGDGTLVVTDTTCESGTEGPFTPFS